MALAHRDRTSYRESIGAWDYEINLEVERYETITKLKDELWHTFGAKMETVQIIPRFKTHKFLSYPVLKKVSRHKDTDECEPPGF